MRIQAEGAICIDHIATNLTHKIEGAEPGPGEPLLTESKSAWSSTVDRVADNTTVGHLARKHPTVQKPCGSLHAKPRHEKAAIPEQDGPPPDDIPVIAAIYPQSADYPATSLIQSGIQQVLRDQNTPYQVAILNNAGEAPNESVSRERRALHLAQQIGVAGVLLWPTGGRETEPDVAQLHGTCIPLVYIERCPANFAVDLVSVDHRGAARDAVTYLLNLGHEQIANLVSDCSLVSATDCVEGYRDALVSHGITPSKDLIYRLGSSPHHCSSVNAVAGRILDQPHNQRPTAVFTNDDRLAHSLIESLREGGLQVPDDISVVGFGDYHQQLFGAPFLTSVHHPFQQIGERAVDLLLRRIASTGSQTVPFKHLLLPASLTINSSCRPLTAQSRDDGTEASLTEPIANRK